MADVIKLTTKIAEMIVARLKQQQQILDEIRDLETSGITDASMYWRDGKFLYLNHPSQNGERVREYVGSDPDKIKEAKAQVERYQRWVKLQSELRHITNGLVAAEHGLEDVSERLKW
jgi:hypothetical protein